MNRRPSPRYYKALSWVQRCASEHPGIRFTAEIGESRLTGWMEGDVIQFQFYFAESRGGQHGMDT